MHYKTPFGTSGTGLFLVLVSMLSGLTVAPSDATGGRKVRAPTYSQLLGNPKKLPPPERCGQVVLKDRSLRDHSDAAIDAATRVIDRIVQTVERNPRSRKGVGLSKREKAILQRLTPAKRAEILAKVHSEFNTQNGGFGKDFTFTSSIKETDPAWVGVKYPHLTNAKINFHTLHPLHKIFGLVMGPNTYATVANVAGEDVLSVNNSFLEPYDLK